MNIFDLIKSTAELQVKAPDGTDLPLTLRIQAGNVATVREKGREAAVVLMSYEGAKNAEDRIAILNRADKALSQQAALAIVGWDNDEIMGKPYTPQYAFELMSKPELEWLRAQVTDFLSAEKNFFRDKPAVAAADGQVES